MGSEMHPILCRDSRWMGGGELWLGGRFGMMRACVDVYRMLMMTFRSLGTHLPLHHLAVTELPIQITSDQVTFPEWRLKIYRMNVTLRNIGSHPCVNHSGIKQTRRLPAAKHKHLPTPMRSVMKRKLVIILITWRTAVRPNITWKAFGAYVSF